MNTSETDQIPTEKLHGRRSSRETEANFSEQYPAEYIELPGGIYLTENQFGALALLRQKALDMAHQRLILADSDELVDSTAAFHADVKQYFVSRSSGHSDSLREPLISLRDPTGATGNDTLKPKLIAIVGHELEKAEEMGALQDAVILLKQKLNANEALLSAERAKQDPDIIELEHQLTLAIGQSERSEESLAQLQREHAEDMIKLGGKDIVIASKDGDIERLRKLLSDNGIDIEELLIDNELVVDDDETESSTLPKRIVRSLAKLAGLESLMPNQK